MVKQGKWNRQACLPRLSVVTGSRRRQGQSIVEYLVIVGVIVAAILAIKTGFGGRVNNLLNGAGNRVDAATGVVVNNIIANRH